MPLNKETYQTYQCGLAYYIYLKLVLSITDGAHKVLCQDSVDIESMMLDDSKKITVTEHQWLNVYVILTYIYMIKVAKNYENPNFIT